MSSQGRYHAAQRGGGSPARMRIHPLPPPYHPRHWGQRRWCVSPAHLAKAAGTS